MNHKACQPKMPDRMEAVFDAAYLIFDLIAGILFFTMAQGRSLFILYGVLTLTLCGGDAFHLVPRIIRAVPNFCRLRLRFMPTRSSSASGCRSLPSP